MTRTHPLSIVALLIPALILAHAPEAAALPREKDRWIQVDSSNFTILSNASPTTAKSVAEDLEQFRTVLAQLTTGKQNSPIPTLIYVFSHDRAFEPYKPIRDGKPADIGSLFQGRRHANYISLNGSLRTETSKAVYTMYAFHFLHNNLPGFAPAWAELAYAYAFDDDPSPRAIVAGETAHRLLPSRKVVANNLLLLYTKAGMREPAQELIDRFFAQQATAAELAEARSQLAHLDLQAAYDLLRDDKTEEAGKIHEDLEAASAGGQVNARMTEQIRRLAQDIEGQRTNDRYNKAVDRYNAGDFAAARDLLQGVLAGSLQRRLERHELARGRAQQMLPAGLRVGRKGPLADHSQLRVRR
ncbi:MAG: hypothetical protein GY719_16805 [bacterium]|nr:hypothetical protein [bacterium]